jgi:hypothetical protein
MKGTAFVLAGVVITLYAAPALAHHSFAMFDHAKTLNLEGTVKEFQWTNPHSWILMMVKNPQGAEEQWDIEIGTPLGLARHGWIPKTLTPGMQITVLVQPLKDGRHGGRAVEVTLPDGTRKFHPYPLGVRTS